MHYANGREAQNGDRVLKIAPAGYYGKPVIGILHDAIPGNDSCNGNLAVPVADQAGCNLAECLHMDDVRAALGDIKLVPNTAKPSPTTVATGPAEQSALPEDPTQVNPAK